MLDELPGAVVAVGTLKRAGTVVDRLATNNAAINTTTAPTMPTNNVERAGLPTCILNERHPFFYLVDLCDPPFMSSAVKDTGHEGRNNSKRELIS